MAKYVVIKDFTDLQDKENHVYRKGDPFPRTGRAKKERIEELIGTDNRRNEQLIEEVQEDDGSNEEAEKSE